MPREKLSPEALTLIDLRSQRGWLQKDLATRIGLSDYRQISRYESGMKPLHRDMLDSIAGVLGYSREAVDALISIHSRISDDPEEDVSPLALTPEESRRINRTALTVGTSVADGVYAHLVARKKRKKAEKTRQQAGEQWQRLRSLSNQKRRELVAGSPDFQGWALAELVCEMSIRAAADDPRKALELANLALFITEHVEGTESWQSRLKGYACAHIANARRVANDFAGADEMFVRAWDLWRSGTDSAPNLLQEWRMLSLEASLRREQHRFSEALELIDRAAHAAGGDPIVYGRIFLKKEHVLEQMGDIPGALAVLEKATPFVEDGGDPRLVFAFRFNTADNLCQMKNYAEAEALLPKVRGLAIELGNDLDLVRVVWLAARIALGQGRREEATASLEQVRRDFTTRQLPYDAARACLELAALWLEEGRTAEVREIALAMVWIFKAQGVAREALGALAIFCDTAQQETATVELVQCALAEIDKVRRWAPRSEYGPRGQD